MRIHWLSVSDREVSSFHCFHSGSLLYLLNYAQAPLWSTTSASVRFQRAKACSSWDWREAGYILDRSPGHRICKISLTRSTFSLFNLAGLQVEAEQRVMMVAEGNSTYLECLPRSRHAAVTWYKQAGENSAELNQVQSHVLHFCFHLCSKSLLQP